MIDKDINCSNDEGGYLFCVHLFNTIMKQCLNQGRTIRADTLKWNNERGNDNIHYSATCPINIPVSFSLFAKTLYYHAVIMLLFPESYYGAIERPIAML